MSTWITGPRHLRWEAVTIRLVAVYTAVVVGLINLFILQNGAPAARAIIIMADGLILLWVVGFGVLTLRKRAVLTDWIRRWDIPWRRRFVWACIALALLEEVITTSMTNTAPLFGLTPQEAHITGSTNYLHVVLFHSVVAFVPMFITWGYLLTRWAFRPLEVLVLFGISGTLAEAGLNPSSLYGGFWVFVYGWMIYLPACSIPPHRGAHRPPFWGYPAAVLLPMVAVAPIVPVVVWLRETLQIPLFVQ